MDASDLNDILASLNPRWDPFMAINTSETCAATRLHQCREMGTQMNDITRKFAGPYDKNRVPDISKIDFSIRRKLIDQVAQWSAELQQKARVSRKFEYEWTPILYMYEVVKTAAKKERDWGHMIFIDSTTTRIFLVMVFPNPCDCGNFSHHDYDALTKYHADRFMSLMKYVYHTDNEPKWIRATYVTPKEQFTLPTEFFKHGSASSTDPTSSNVEKIDGKPPIITVLANDFVPSLLGSEVEKIDNLFARGRDSSKPERSQALKNQVTGEKETRPQVSKTWQSKQPRECSNCHTAKETGMMICSRCKLAHYCGKECQKEAWPRHKPLCKKFIVVTLPWALIYQFKPRMAPLLFTGGGSWSEVESITAFPSDHHLAQSLRSSRFVSLGQEMSTTPAVPTLGDLKRLRNSVIGNPLAKRTLADDDRAVRILVDYLNPPLPHNAEVTAMRTEAAHIVASLAHGSDSTLGALLRHDAPRALLFAVSNFGPQDSLPLRSAFARALRTAGSALADSVGPPLYGIPSAERSAIHKEAKEALANFFTPESLDTTLPLLSAPPGTAPVIPTAVAQLVASSVRSPEYRKLIIEWVPADQRPYRRPSVAELEEATSPKSSRGWEKPVVSVGMTTEFAVAANGGWVVSVLVGLLGSKDAKAQEAALEAIGALVRDTPAIALVLVRSASSDVAAPITLVHSLIKSRHTDVQLAACLCATRIIRASNSSLLATHYLNQSDDTCAKSILSVVNRILASGLDDKEILIKACFILYYLIADDRKLSQFAFERGCLDGLATVFKQITPSEFKDSWDESEAESVFRLREAALTTLASFSLFDTEIRRCVTDKHELLPYVSVSLTCRYTGVRYAACQVVRMLSRAVGVLRTSITDSGLGMAVFELFKKGMDGGIAKGKDRIVEGEDVRVVDAALKAICNLVVEFSPLASKLLEEGVMAHLLQLIHSEDADDRSISLRLNAMWAVKNLLFKSPIEMKKDVMNQFGWTVLYDFLNDPSDDIREQAYNILRNVTENEDGISLVFRELCPLPTLHSSPFPISDRNLLDAIAELLSSPSSPNNVVVQATYVVANMANGYPKDTMEIVKHSGFLEALRTVIAERGSDVRRPAVGCILNLVQEREQAKDRRRAMVRAGVADTLRRVCEWAPITSAVSGSRPMARRMSHGTISGGAVGVPTVGGYLHPSDRTGVSVSPTQTRGTLGHQRSLTATFPVSNPGGTASIPGASQGVASPPGASPLYTALRTGAAATHSAVPMSVATTYRGPTYIPGWLPEHGLRTDGSTVMPYLDERGSGSGTGGSGRAGVSPTGATYGNWGPQWHSAAGAPMPSSPSPGLGGAVGGVGAAGGTMGSGIGAGSALGPISPAPSGGHTPVHPAMDIDKEVYERAKRALDYLEHGDSYTL